MKQVNGDWSPTFGARAVGLGFNPSNNPDVDVVKQSFAALIDKIAAAQKDTRDPEAKRLCSIAITQMQTAQMWAVKALTWE